MESGAPPLSALGALTLKRTGETFLQLELERTCLFAVIRGVGCFLTRQTRGEGRSSHVVQSKPEDSNSNIHEVIGPPRALRRETAFMRLRLHH